LHFFFKYKLEWKKQPPTSTPPPLGETLPSHNIWQHLGYQYCLFFIHSQQRFCWRRFIRVSLWRFWSILKLQNKHWVSSDCLLLSCIREAEKRFSTNFPLIKKRSIINFPNFDHELRWRSRSFSQRISFGISQRQHSTS
jgi:hypothetical protein